MFGVGGLLVLSFVGFCLVWFGLLFVLLRMCFVWVWVLVCFGIGYYACFLCILHVITGCCWVFVCWLLVCGFCYGVVGLILVCRFDFGGC